MTVSSVKLLGVQMVPGKKLIQRLFGRTETAKEINCCKSPELSDKKIDLGHAESMDYILRQCNSCNRYWLNVFCIATAITGYESVKDSDAKSMLSLCNTKELKPFMKAWGREKI